MQEVQAGFSLERLAAGAIANSDPVAARFFITSPLLLSTVKGTGVVGYYPLPGTGPFVDTTRMIWYCHSMGVMQAHSQKRMLWYMGTVALSVLSHVSAYAIDVHPTAKQIKTAIEQGNAAAEMRSTPESFYVWFGVSDAVTPRGFLVTKLGALSIMASHMALRGHQPSESDVRQVLESQTMLVSTVIFGNAPNFAVDSYIVLEQSGKTIKPVTVRFDAQADRSVVYPKTPRFKAKVVGSFNYADFDPLAETTITVYPATGGEASFSMNFLDIH
jgi:hypothetical protein